MCGIAGILRLHDPNDGPPPHPLEAIPEAWLDVLDKSIKHRGPDGQGRFRDRAVREDGTVADVAFVHRRLSIIDHEGGRQPMVHDGKRLRPDLTYQAGETPKLAHELCPADESPDLVAVVFNGCIYNHRELRAELEASGHVFETDHSDTEVLVHGWRAWGHQDQHRLAFTRMINGMYGLLAWDRQEASLAPLRDTFCEKPLYFKHGPGVCAWASVAHELPSVSLGSSIPLLSAVDITNWIRHGWNCQFAGVGHIKECYDSGVAQADEHGKPLPGGFGLAHWIDYAGSSADHLSPERVDILLRQAVRSRLESDVPLGCFLSGGIDSSLIARYASEELSGMRCYTVAMPEPAYDESRFARQVAGAIGVELEVLPCDPDPAEDLISLIQSIGLPFGDSSLLPTYWVCRAAGESVRVALAGDGGDELFCGYERHTAYRISRPIESFARLLPSGVLPDRDPKSRSSKLRRLIRATQCGRGSFAPELAAIYPRRELHQLVQDADRKTPDAINAIKNRSCSVRIWDLDAYLRGDLLRKTDTASMAVPLEVRCPFLDPELARAAILAPVSDLMPNGQRKGLLKQVARRYLPDHIVDRPKKGFAIPVGQWFRSDYGGMRQLLYDHLESADPFPGLGEAGVEINTAFVRRMLREHDAAGEKSLNPWHGRDHSQRLYMLLVLSIWAKWLDRVRREDA